MMRKLLAGCLAAAVIGGGQSWAQQSSAIWLPAPTSIVAKGDGSNPTAASTVTKLPMPIITSVCDVRARSAEFNGKHVRLMNAFIWTDGHHGAAIDDRHCRHGIAYRENPDTAPSLAWDEINPIRPSTGEPQRDGDLGLYGSIDGEIVVEGRSITLVATAADVKVTSRPSPVCPKGTDPKVGTEQEAKRLAKTVLPRVRKAETIFSANDFGWTWIVTKIGDDPLQDAPSVEIEKCSGAVSRWP